MRVKDLKKDDVVIVKLPAGPLFTARVLSTFDRSRYEDKKWVECGLIEYQRISDGKRRSCDIQYIKGLAQTDYL